MLDIYASPSTLLVNLMSVQTTTETPCVSTIHAPDKLHSSEFTHRLEWMALYKEASSMPVKVRRTKAVNWIQSFLQD